MVVTKVKRHEGRETPTPVVPPTPTTPAGRMDVLLLRVGVARVVHE